MHLMACRLVCPRIRPLNLVVISQDGTITIKLIDFDASAKHGELCHLKFSSAFAPPQLAAELLAYESNTGHKPTSASAPVPWAEWLRSRGSLKASVATDIWAFGMLAFKLCAEDGASMFLSSEADNIVRTTDLEVLAYFWNQHILKELTRVVWDDAADMILKCLQAAEASRPQSFGELLEHPFFETSRTCYFPEPLTTRAHNLHSAIESGNVESVACRLQAGGVHLLLVDESRTCRSIKGAGATPLMRAAFTGDAGIARALLGELEDTWPETVRKQYLDQRTTYGFTAYMIACACGREDIATLFEAKGCSVGLTNDFGKTGAVLLQASHTEHTRSTCESLETYLALFDRKAIVMSCPEMGTLDEDGGKARMAAGADASEVYNQRVMDKVSELQQLGFVKFGFDRAGTSTTVETEEEQKKWSKAIDGTLPVTKVGDAMRALGLHPSETELQDKIKACNTDGMMIQSKSGGSMTILAGSIDFVDFVAMARKMNTTTPEDDLKKSFLEFAEPTPEDVKEQIFKSTSWWYGYQTSVKQAAKLESQGYGGVLDVTCIHGGAITRLEAKEMEQIMQDAKSDCAKSGISVNYEISYISYREFLLEYDPSSAKHEPSQELELEQMVKPQREAELTMARPSDVVDANDGSGEARHGDVAYLDTAAATDIAADEGVPPAAVELDALIEAIAREATEAQREADGKKEKLATLQAQRAAMVHERSKERVLRPEA